MTVFSARKPPLLLCVHEGVCTCMPVFVHLTFTNIPVLWSLCMGPLMWGSFCYIRTLQGREPRLGSPRLSKAAVFATGKAELWAQAVWFWSLHSMACFSGIQGGQCWDKDVQDFSGKENAKVTADLLVAFIVLFPQLHSNLWILWTRGSQSGAELHLAMSGDIFDCLNWKS